MKKILIISSDFPYPPNHGGRVDVFERIVALKEMNFEVTLISTVKEKQKKEDIKYMKKYCKNIFLINRQTSIANVLTFLPYQVKSRLNDEEIIKLQTFLKSSVYDYAILEGHYVISLYINLLNSIQVKTAYLRVQNNEVTYFNQLSQSADSLAKKVFYKLESLKFHFYEKKIFKEKRISKCLHISFDEYSDYKKRYPYIENIFLPASLNISEMIFYKESSKQNVLFVGSLFMPNNIEGLKWYLENIHGKLIHKFKDYMLIIAGNTKGIDKDNLIKYLNKFSNVSFVDSPDSLTELYRKATVFINPMLSGAGVKLKTINALKEGLPVVSTVVGNEGTGLVHKTHILIANDKYKFLENVVDILQDEKLRKTMVTNAQSFLYDNYNQIKILKELLK